MEAWIVLSLLVLAVALFASERFTVDIVTLMLLCALVLTGILSVEEAFAGFSSGIVVMLASIFVIGAALRDSGILDVIAQGLGRLVGKNEGRLTALMMGGVGLLSAFMNNTTVTAMCVGPMVRLARELRIGPGRLLMPLAFASILGGTCTLIGTSTNVAVSGYLKKNQLGELGMFEFAGLGLLMLIAGMVYMIFIGRHLLPNQVEEVDDVVVRDYLAEAVVLEGSPLIGQHVIASDFSILGFQVLKIVRGKDQLEDVQSLRFEQGDVVLLAGRVKDLIKIKKIEGIEIMEDLRLLRGGVNLRNVQIAEVVVTPRSRLVGRTLKESKFRQSSGLSVLALMRGDKSMTGLIADTMVRAGDMLLVQGPMDRIRRYEDDAELVVISEHLTAGYGMKKGLILLGLFLLAITASSIGLLPAALALLMVAVAAVLMRAITMEVAYENIEWRLLILIAGMMGFGQAMQSSGAAELVAGAVVSLLLPLGSLAVLGGFSILAMLLTQQMTNAAAALVILPVALQAAERLSLNPRPFALAVMLSASVAVLTPFEPSCLLVYGPGKLKFRDYIRVGGGLAVICLILILIFVPMFWPLE